LFSNIIGRIEEPEIKDLLYLCVFPDTYSLKKIIEKYKASSKLQLYGIGLEGKTIGLIGYQYIDKKVIEITHISVKPEFRGKGFGRVLISELLNKENPKEVTVETDDDAVEFYRHIGFVINSLGEKYPGVERYSCSFKS